MIDEADLLRMTPKERRELAHALAAIELPHPMLERRLIRRRRFGLVFMIGACLVLAPWIAWLMFELPMDFTARHWRGVWVGLDIVELAAFAATAWAAWFQRQIVILLMILTGTLLVCDAWFDVALEFGTHGFTSSVVMALLVELPVAFLLFNGARRLVRLTVHGVMRLQGITGPLPRLWQIPLFADGLAEALPYRRRAATPEGRSASELGPRRLYSAGVMGPRQADQPDTCTVAVHVCCGTMHGGCACRHAVSLTADSVAVPGATARKMARAGCPPG